ncbi:hypothetical protein SAMN04489798_4334 [Pseudomonas arsenicoxydans]|uniref:Uncharacterized protein n=1 Tax=Pseudomonas arsenicoxydans TaxID=702115 RepID=A0A1H0NXQ9_9PSED|nr:hypothetical protein [Pseudomonas arsenicoxydans]SDO97215.1 hypothetical protein SAMN04489798_4334 [Pseudomonas arsenicoxydans]
MGVKESIEGATSNKEYVDEDKPLSKQNKSSYLVNPNGFHKFSMLLGGYAVFLFGLYGILSFSSPDFIFIFKNNISGTLGILTIGFVLFCLIATLIEKISSSSFVSIDRKARAESNSFVGKAMRSMAQVIADSVEYPGGIDIRAPRERIIEIAKGTQQESPETYKTFERERVLGTAYEVYVFSVIESLDKHISLTEEKGSNLLDRGLLFLFGGILFYIMAIIGWQMWAKYGEPEVSVMYIGMFASSVVFLVCEFLAAWFLKQYRHYVDASLACLRVKSVYDRYMLSYYAVKEMAPEGYEISEKLNRVLEALKQDVSWPGHKDNMNNDFNYIVESMNTVHASLDKVKGLFDSKARSAPSESQSSDK